MLVGEMCLILWDKKGGGSRCEGKSIAVSPLNIPIFEILDEYMK